MHKFFGYINIILKLGLPNVLYAVWYRLSLKTGIRKLFFPQHELPHCDIFYKAGSLRTGYPVIWKQQLIADADKILSGYVRYYAFHWEKIGNPPDWFLDPFTGEHYSGTDKHWTKLPDFSPGTGDIKNIWEPSRFEWVVTLARAYAVTGNNNYLILLNNWLRDWTIKNPLNTGPDWKCGQEAAIRVINLVLVSTILEPTESLADLICYHLERINGNILYAISQDNNHGTSEATGLFIGGSCLASIDKKKYSGADRYAAKGRNWLENRMRKLVSPDGSFSQHSVNYHRVMLDTIAFAEYWRSKIGQQPFSRQFYDRAEAATRWLWQMTDKTSGNAPNLGANDGALINHFHQAPYNDFRPSIQLASVMFIGYKMIENGIWDEPLWWLDEKKYKAEIRAASNENIVIKSGYVVLNKNDSWCLLRFPHFRFRPSHNDIFHIDIWYKGVNIICDAGSFSYNPPEKYADLNLKSVRSHNTVSFDGEEQMPELSRFLLGNWIKPDETGEIEYENDGISWKGSYTDLHGNKHIRKISCNDYIWVIKDTLSGRFNKAVIGFNINSLNCTIENKSIVTPYGLIIVPEDSSLFLEETFVSEHYNEIKIVQRLNIEVKGPGTYTTAIHLK